ncbi:MAG: fibronectin type III domain-containing protein [Candidatus Schekmanbacteria bacterium]|nr:fibronectin type III domain-containing protein [Candidatus Schekmanbacteria bacterium]
MPTPRIRELPAAVVLWIALSVSTGGAAENPVTGVPSATPAAPLLLAPAATDTVAPAWPDGSRLTAAYVALEEVTLEWTAATDENGVTAYRVYQNGGLRDHTGPDDRRYVATRLTSLTDFRFSVEAGDTAGNWSTAGPALVVRIQPIDTEPPSLYTSHLEVVEVTGTTARLRWGPGTDDVGVTKYVVWGTTRNLAETDGSTLEATVTGLRPGRRYEARLVAFDRAGNVSSERPRAAFMAIDPGVPAPPAKVVVGPSDFYKGIEDELHPGWKASTSPGIVTYRLYRRHPGESEPTLLGEYPPGSVTDKGLDPAQTYYYSVSAVDDRGVEGPRSTEAAGIPRQDYLKLPSHKLPPEVALSFARILQGEDPREELARNEYGIKTAPDGLPLVLYFREPARGHRPVLYRPLQWLCDGRLRLRPFGGAGRGGRGDAVRPRAPAAADRLFSGLDLQGRPGGRDFHGGSTRDHRDRAAAQGRRRAGSPPRSRWSPASSTCARCTGGRQPSRCSRASASEDGVAGNKTSRRHRPRHSPRAAVTPRERSGVHLRHGGTARAGLAAPFRRAGA